MTDLKTTYTKEEVEAIIGRMMEAAQVDNIAELANKLALQSPDSIYTNRKNLIIPKRWISLLSTITGASANWLLTGRGRPPAAPQASESAALWGRTTREEAAGQALDVTIYGPESDLEEPANSTPAPDPGEFTYLPMYEPKLSAGGGALIEDERIISWFAFRRRYLHAVGTAMRNLVLFRVRGASMSPTILDGDTVMVDRGRTHVYSGYIYAVAEGDSALIKRLYTMVDGCVKIVGDNQTEYEPQVARPENLNIIGQVVWFARTLVQL